ncbi:MAG TPA: hypothetical protein VKU85_06260, partial [bacterium]|nr:hypothetical protein [bacterium]
DLLDRRIFTYADVPYRISPYREIVRDPHRTIRFDPERQRTVERRVAELGADGRLVPDAAGGIRHATLLEKLLVPALSKLSNLVPGGGIWMNTQRPEWNDANNALAGEGLSVVTMCHLRRYLVFLERLIGDFGRTAEVSTEVTEWMRALDGELKGVSDRPATAAERRRWMDAAGEAFSRYRGTAYDRGLSGAESLPSRAAAEFCRHARQMLDREIAGQRRTDGLYHAYNVLERHASAPGVRPLQEMLEGQVAALSSGVMSARETVDLVDEMYRSALYRQDQRSFLLYPERELPSFLQRNVVPERTALAVPLLRAMLDAGDARVVARDVDGVVRFHADLENARALEASLNDLAGDARWGDGARTDRSAVLDLYESVFRHRLFTGRSGRMYGYEGLGCIYWHMVAKLLLAVQEIAVKADEEGEPTELRAALADAYYRIRDGLGFRKTAAEYGAFPTDPYSHTPRHAGARQPGMTGQAKEEILTRLGELGVRIRDGELRFRPVLLRRDELLSEPCAFPARPDGARDSLRVPEGGLAFTFCGVPVVYAAGDDSRITVVRRDGSELRLEGDTLSAEAADPIFDRDGSVVRIEVTVPERILLGSR